MSIGGVKQRLLNEIISFLFGEPAAIVAEAIERCGPCPIGLVAQVTNFPLEDAKTVALSMYLHGVVNITREGSQTFLSISSLPAFILSAPSILIDQIEEQYQKPSYCEILKLILFHGIIEYTPPNNDKSKKKKVKAISPQIDLPDGFQETVDELIEIGILSRRVVECESFSTCDVFSLMRRIENLNLSKKRTNNANSTQDLGTNRPSESAKSMKITDNTYSLTINWNGVASFLRGRYLVQFSQTLPNLNGTKYMKLIECIIGLSHCGDYTNFQRMMSKDDDNIRTDVVSYPHLEYSSLSRVYTPSQDDDLFTLLDTISESQMNFMCSRDGTYWELTTPKSIRAFQIQHIESFLKQDFSAYHCQCFNSLRKLGVADTHQIEGDALLSEKDARSTMYALCRFGFAQMQSIPRSSADKMINPKSIFAFRYDEEAAIEGYRFIIGEHARRYLSKISELHKEYEQNEQMEAGNMTAAKANEKKEKHLYYFNASYSKALSAFILFAEM